MSSTNPHTNKRMSFITSSKYASGCCIPTVQTSGEPRCRQNTHPIILVSGTRMLHTQPHLRRITHLLAQPSSLIQELIFYHILPRVLKHTVSHICGRIDVLGHTDRVTIDKEMSGLAITEWNWGGSIDSQQPCNSRLQYHQCRYSRGRTGTCACQRHSRY